MRSVVAVPCWWFGQWDQAIARGAGGLVADAEEELAVAVRQGDAVPRFKCGHVLFREGRADPHRSRANFCGDPLDSAVEGVHGVASAVDGGELAEDGFGGLAFEG